MTNQSAAHPNAEILRAVYADLTSLGDYADDKIVLHAAERKETDGLYIGRQAAVDKEHELITDTGDTLHMDVQSIIANDYFGAVLGTLRAERGGDVLAMPFCGLWRFEDGKIVEHWENAYDAAMVGKFLLAPMPFT